MGKTSSSLEEFEQMDIDQFFQDEAPKAADALESENVITRMTRAWVNERFAPEILPFETGLVEGLASSIRRQIEHIEDESSMDLDSKRNFSLIIIQMDLERARYLVRTYLRTRLAKIDRFGLAILAKATLRIRLSAYELTYCRRHQALLTQHYRSCFLSTLPETLQRLDDTAAGLKMIEEPNLDSAVFARVCKPINQQLVLEGDERIALEEGNIFIIRYNLIREFIADGSIQLI